MAATYVLGPFRLDAETDTLFRGAEPVSLGHRAVALLRVLVEQRGIPVSKDALMEAAWAGLTVEESNLAVQIAALHGFHLRRQCTTRLILMRRATSLRIT